MITSRLYSIARAASAAPAAPAGGGPIAGCRGCGLTQITAAFILTLGCVPSQPAFAAEWGEPVAVPSGQLVYLAEVLSDDAPGALWLRFRFVAPAIGNDVSAVSFDHAITDMDHLCQNIALTYLRTHEVTPERIAISLSDRLVPFGEADPDATQFFEVFSPDATTCIWEAF